MWRAYTKEFKYNWHLAAPVILGMLGHVLVGFVDNIMVGQLGAAELAAVSLGNSFFFVAMALGIGFSTAITPLVAESHSEQNHSKGKSALIHGLCTLCFNRSGPFCAHIASKTPYVQNGSAAGGCLACTSVFRHHICLIDSTDSLSSI